MTITLSATGSTNAPKADDKLYFLAIYPSKKSVIQDTKYNPKANARYNKR